MKAMQTQVPHRTGGHAAVRERERAGWDEGRSRCAGRDVRCARSVEIKVKRGRVCVVVDWGEAGDFLVEECVMRCGHTGASASAGRVF